MNPTPRGYYLGKRDARPPVLPFLSYYATAEGLPAPPDQVHYGSPVTVPFGMLGNGPDPSVTIMGPDFEGVGDCYWAAVAHGILSNNYVDEGNTVTMPTANDVVTAYCTYLGCTPAQLEADPSLDQGTDNQTALTQWAQTGYYGFTLPAWAPVDQTNHTEVQQAIAFFGGMLLGIQIEEAQEQEFPNEWVWVDGSPIIGGHDIWCTGYNEDAVYFCSWGQLVLNGMPWSTFDKLAEEAQVLIFPQVVAAGEGPTPGYGGAALALSALQADIGQLDA